MTPWMWTIYRAFVVLIYFNWTQDIHYPTYPIAVVVSAIVIVLQPLIAHYCQREMHDRESQAAYRRGFREGYERCQSVNGESE